MRESVTNLWESVPITIANGQSISGAANLGGLRLFGIVMPAAWTAASITFQMSADGGSTWNNVYDQNGNEVTVTAGSSRFIALDPATLPAVQWLQARSGTASSPVNQGADRSLTLVLRSV